MKDILEAYGPEQVALVSWWCGYPHSIPESMERWDFYDLIGIPTAWFGGIDEVLGGSGSTMFPAYNPIVASQLLMSSPIEIDAYYQMSTETDGTLHVDILVTETITTMNNVVWCVIVENGIGEDEVLNVARDALPAEPFTPTQPGETLSFERPFVLDLSWDQEEISYIVFVQSEDAGRQVLQSAWGHADPTGIDIDATPIRAALLPNYPNPFNPTTSIEFEIPTRTRASLRIYDVSGHLVRVLEDSEFEAGRHTVMWDGTDRDGMRVVSGLYLSRLEAGPVTDTRTMLLLK